jgi:serine/threonine protein kinase
VNDPQLNLDFSTRTFRLPQAGDTSEASEKAPVTKIELQPHSKIANRYVLLEIVGAGAFGSVFLATDLELQRNVAIKLSHARNPDERHLEAMRREARAAARFEHPHVVRVYDFGVHEQRPYIIYEYIQGESLQSLLARKHLDLRQALEILCKVADAMDVAHREGVFHRDLKPSNILVDDRFEPHVTDFGLALSYQEQQAHRGEVAGTLSYMSPEQIEGKAHFLDGRADIWSMGVMLYRVLTGRLPFTGTQAEISEQVLSRTPTPPRQINPADDSRRRRGLAPIFVPVVATTLVQDRIGDRLRVSAVCRRLGVWILALQE